MRSAGSLKSVTTDSVARFMTWTTSARSASSWCRRASCAALRASCESVLCKVQTRRTPLPCAASIMRTARSTLRFAPQGVLGFCVTWATQFQCSTSPSPRGLSAVSRSSSVTVLTMRDPRSLATLSSRRRNGLSSYAGNTTIVPGRIKGGAPAASAGRFRSRSSAATPRAPRAAGRRSSRRARRSPRCSRS